MYKMELVVDANVLFSALIKNNVTAKLLCHENLKLYCPEFVLEELEKYYEEILEKTSRTQEEFMRIMEAFEEIITIVPQEEYADYIEEAKKSCPDQNDIMYFALALRLKCSLWSNDKILKNQDIIKVYNTAEVKTLIS